MALIGNAGLNARSPVRNFGITSPGNERSAWNQHGMSKNFSLHESDPTGSNKTGYPNGRLHPYSWSMPFKPGGMAAVLNARGAATVTGDGAMGINTTGSSAGVATASATGQLVVSGTGSAAGSATVTGSLQAALLGTGSSAGVATTSGTLKAKGWMTGASQGVASSSSSLKGIGRLTGAIAPATELDAATFANYLLDQTTVETGLPLRKAFRLLTAATAGKASGLSGTTAVYRNAVADSKDRITATVDADGNRTVITYDLDD